MVVELEPKILPDDKFSAVANDSSLCFGVACTVLCPPILILFTVYSLGIKLRLFCKPLC